MSRVEQIGDCTLYLGDAREILPALGVFDRMITDVPYGVGETRGSGLRKTRGEKTNYDSFDDTPEYIESVIVPIIKVGIDKSKSSAITPGFKCMWKYPEPKHVGGFQYSGTTVMSSWGPCLWQPIFYYGKDPHPHKLKPDSFPGCNDVDRETAHPCPKPLGQWTKLVLRASVSGDVVIDPLMGSGTTLVACAKNSRRGVGIELSEQYFDVACERVQKAYDQPDLFVVPPKKAEQTGFDLTGEKA